MGTGADAERHPGVLQALRDALLASGKPLLLDALEFYGDAPEEELHAAEVFGGTSFFDLLDLDGGKARRKEIDKAAPLQVTVKTPAEFDQVAASVIALRRTGKTPMNAKSSRSHLFMRLSTGDRDVMIGDIAGNEPYRRFTDPQVRAEGRAIVGNLYALRDYLAQRPKNKVVTRVDPDNSSKPLVLAFKKFVPAKAPVRVILAANPSADWERITQTASSFDDVALLLGPGADGHTLTLWPWMAAVLAIVALVVVPLVLTDAAKKFSIFRQRT
jgi:hypothetical protein